MKRIAKVSEQTGKRIDDLTKRIEEAGRKGKRTLSDGEKHANKMSKSLDKVVTKWLSIGGAITLVSRLIRRAFARIDELVGLNRMAQSAGVLDKKIYSLGRHLKELYGGDASSVAGAYTSVGDIIGAARSGRGISQDVVEAASRYGIALNGGMLTEDQLMTNIARAMQVQRKKGNMYGVRDIASAFGIDEAMMLHLSEKGANWDRGLPAANIEEAKQAALKAKQLQEKLDNMINQLIDTFLPALVSGLQVLTNIVQDIAENVRSIVNFKYKPAQKAKPDFEKAKEFYKSTGMSEDEADAAANRFVSNMDTRLKIVPYAQRARELSEVADKNIGGVAKSFGFVGAMLNRGIEKYMTDRAVQAELDGKITLVLENNTGNKASVSSADFGTASIGFQTIGE